MELKGTLKLSETEKNLISDNSIPPFKITKHWISLLNGRKDDPLRMQAVPSESEKIILPYELSDPLGEKRYSPAERLVHRYRNRALVIITGKCALYCRHCFRRAINGDSYGEITYKQAENISVWLKNHKEVKELLLSGGDPLTLKEEKLKKLFGIFRSAGKHRVFRLATRMPVVDPERVTENMAAAAASVFPLWLVIQVNHPDEISPGMIRAVKKFQLKGIPVLNQSVLLKGINDKVEILEELSNKLVAVGIKPYYLFLGDLAEGTSHFRTGMEKSLELSEELRKRLSGIGMPVLAVDVPDGGGKVPIVKSRITGNGVNGWQIETIDGETGFYPE